MVTMFHALDITSMSFFGILYSGPIQYINSLVRYELFPWALNQPNSSWCVVGSQMVFKMWEYSKYDEDIFDDFKSKKLIFKMNWKLKSILCPTLSNAVNY